MRIPISWLKDYVKLPKDLNLLTDKLTMAGHLLDKIDKSDNDIVIDLELRGNRADCYSVLGIAREVSALFKTPVKYPPIYPRLKKVSQLPECKNSINTPYVKRVMMAVIKNVKICQSPPYIKKRLEAYGIPSINNIVDLTNFIMLETGEPMHAFDLDALGNQIEIRLAKKDEKITTFLDQSLSLTADDLVWANPTSLLSVAGAIGEKHRSINPNTKNILIEAASYDRANIRRTIYRHNLLTDAGIRHEKDLDSNLVDFAIYRSLQIINENRWGKIKPYVFDYYPEVKKSWLIDLNIERLKEFSGIDIKLNKIKEILKRLNFIVVKKNKNILRIKIPTLRTDVTNEEDVIEEILRIYGYENIPSRTIDLSVPPDVTPVFINQELTIKDSLSALGFNEIISLTFVKEKFSNLNKNLFNNKNTTIDIANAPSPDIKYLRSTLFPNLYEISKRAVYERSLSIRYFEVGKVFSKRSKYVEGRSLGIIFWDNESKISDIIFKGYIEALFQKIGLNDSITYKGTLEAPLLHKTYNILVNNKIAGIAGKYEEYHYCEIALDDILNKNRKYKAYLWPKYPPQIEDVTFIFPQKTYIGDVLKLIQNQKLITKAELVRKYKDSYSFRIYYQSPTKTLNDNEVEKIRNKVLSLIKFKFGGSQKN